MWLELLLVVASLVPASFGLVMLRAGLRGGDRLGELTVAGVAAAPDGRTLAVWLVNGGSSPVVVGLSIARASLRLRISGGLIVRVPRRTSAGGLLATRHSVLGVVPAGSTGCFDVPGEAPDVSRRIGLVVCAGGRDRLRVITRSVSVPSPTASAVPAPVYASRDA